MLTLQKRRILLFFLWRERKIREESNEYPVFEQIEILYSVGVEVAFQAPGNDDHAHVLSLDPKTSSTLTR
jgi:hypothetical protein